MTIPDTEPKVVISPALAEVLGANEAAFLYVAHTLACCGQLPTKNVDGHLFVRIAQADLIAEQTGPLRWMKNTALLRAILHCKKAGVLMTANYNERKTDNTRWYAINYMQAKALTVTGQ